MVSGGGVCCVPELSVFGVLLSCGLAVELPEAPPADEVLDGFDVLSGVVCGVLGAVFGVTVSGVCGCGFVLLPPDGVCSLIGDELCDELLLLCDCATTTPVDRIASVARYASFFIGDLP